MAKYTKEEVIAGRKCGLKYFDIAVSNIGREQLIANAIKISKTYPDTWGFGWDNFSWAIGNAVIEAVNSAKEFPQSWNLDEALTTEEMSSIKKELGFAEYTTVCWKRRTLNRKREKLYQ